MASVPDLDEEGVRGVLAGFRGPIDQVPPMYSALKKDGRRLYEMARKGQIVERPPRRITIHAIELLSISRPDISFRVCCSKGTYVRTLVEDVAAALGTVGHVTALRRTASGPFDIENCRSNRFPVRLDSMTGCCRPIRRYRICLLWYSSRSRWERFGAGSESLMSATTSAVP